MKICPVQFLSPVFVALLFSLIGCNPSLKEPTSEEVPHLRVEEVPAPGSNQARFPRLATGSTVDNQLYLSWIEEGSEPSIQLAVYRSGTDRWQPLPPPVQDSALLVNWADFPQLAVNGQGGLTLQYLKTADPSEPYAYHVWQTHLEANAASWSPSYRLHSDTSLTEHGFISSALLSRDSLASIWLDGRKYASSASHDHHSGEGTGEMTLYFRTSALSGQLGTPQEIDGRTCDCCNTALAALPAGGLIAAYRDRSREEVRDIYYTRYQNRQWTEPQPIAQDNWQVYGCPVNGPALASYKEKVALAWYTGAGGDGCSYA